MTGSMLTPVQLAEEAMRLLGVDAVLAEARGAEAVEAARRPAIAHPSPWRGGQEVWPRERWSSSGWQRIDCAHR